MQYNMYFSVLAFLRFLFYSKTASFGYRCTQSCMIYLFTIVNLALVTFVNTNENVWIIRAGMRPIQSPD